MHDTVNLEGAGVPTVFVASSAFVAASAAQASSLGANPASVFVAHPIQDRTNDEIIALAEAAFGEILIALTA